jgi:hypothetical protein
MDKYQKLFLRNSFQNIRKYSLMNGFGFMVSSEQDQIFGYTFALYHLGILTEKQFKDIYNIAKSYSKVA